MPAKTDETDENHGSKRDGNRDRRRHGKRNRQGGSDKFEKSEKSGKDKENKGFLHNRKDQNRESGKSQDATRKQRPYYSKRRRTQKKG